MNNIDTTETIRWAHKLNIDEIDKLIEKIKEIEKLRFIGQMADYMDHKEDARLYELSSKLKVIAYDMMRMRGDFQC